MSKKILSQASFFDGLAETWDDIWTDDLRARIKKVMLEDVPPLNHPILDIGNGTGVMIPYLREKSTGAFPIIELDISKRMLEVGRTKLKSATEALFIHGDAHKLPFVHEQFNTIFCFSVFPHFKRPETVLSEFYRCLAKHGLLVIMHVQGHAQLNAMHATIEKCVSSDILQPVDQLAVLVRLHQFKVLLATEHAEKYLLIAEKQ
ncbi:MAG: class I SAM-dependent methyltransferase [Deferribacteres bacterium]|nr:class I SAM-dependent methyltransferase [candidate division KSB1 bacterium]MCB9501833.1 class I SAM-dependent methyltransferase [Deferribacteres bacterium]